MQTQELIRKISNLPQDQLFEVEHFICRLESRANGERKLRDMAIRAYAEEFAGTDHDLDPELEAAGIEHLIEAETL